MTPLWETVTELTSQAEILRCRTYGVIEAADGRFRRVVLRPWPKIVSAPGILLAGACATVCRAATAAASTTTSRGAAPITWPCPTW